MTAQGLIRGRPVEYDYDDEIWRWTDTLGPASFWSGGKERPCPACDLMAEPGGPDPCLGWLPGVIGACCGHGVEPVSVVVVGSDDV